MCVVERHLYAKPTASREAVQLWGMVAYTHYGFREAGLMHPIESTKRRINKSRFAEPGPRPMDFMLVHSLNSYGLM